MDAVNIHEAKTQFSKLVARAERGEEIVIARSGRPVAKIVRYAARDRGKRPLGLFKGQIQMSEDFDDPLPDGFWNGPIFPDEDED